MSRFLEKEIIAKLSKLKKIDKKIEAVGVGGTITTLAAIEKKIADYNREEINKAVLNLDRINSIFSNLISVSLDERKRIVGLPSDRADIIIGGTLILCKLLERLGLKKIRVDVFGLRLGYLLDKLGF